MCKDRRMCTELGNDPGTWSTHALLAPPQWLRDQLPVFSNSVRAAAEGRIKLAIDLLKTVRSDDLRDWFVEHGARSGKFRWKIRRELLGFDQTVPEYAKRNHKQPNAELQRLVLGRDGYRCRYCGIGLVPKNVLVDFGDIVDSDEFRAKTDKGRHGAILAFRANFDHVTPASHGGTNELSNLVSCCWSCNYGKRNLTLHQIGLVHPLTRQPCETSDWDGLTDVASSLAIAASQIRRSASQSIP